jgi:spore germination protein KB
MVFLGLLLLFITIALWEGPALVKQRLWGELILFVVLLLLGAAYGFGPGPGHSPSQSYQGSGKSLDLSYCPNFLPSVSCPARVNQRREGYLMLKEDRISGSQAFNLLVITVMGTEILIFPSFAARGAGVDAWLVPAVALVGALLVVLAQIRLAANFPGQTVAQYSRLVLGNLPGRLVSLAYAWFFLHLAALVLRRFGGLMETVFLRETLLVVILLVMGILAVSAVRNGLGCLARVNELIAAIVVAAVLILLSLIAKELDISSLQPVLAAGFLPLLRSAAVPIAWYREVVVLLYIIPHLQKPERGTTIVLAVLLVSAAFFTISTMASIMLFGPDGTARMAFPFVSLARRLE